MRWVLACIFRPAPLSEVNQPRKLKMHVRHHRQQITPLAYFFLFKLCLVNGRDSEKGSALLSVIGSIIPPKFCLFFLSFTLFFHTLFVNIVPLSFTIVITIPVTTFSSNFFSIFVIVMMEVMGHVCA